MLTYFKGGFNDYTIRVEPIPSGSTHLGIRLQDMTTQEEYSEILSPGNWSYSEYESFVSFSIDLDAITLQEAPTSAEFRLDIFPLLFPSGSQTLLGLPTVYHGSIGFFTQQTEDKTSYKNQIPLPEDGVSPFESNPSSNRFIILQ